MSVQFLLFRIVYLGICIVAYVCNIPFGFNLAFQIMNIITIYLFYSLWTFFPQCGDIINKTTILILIFVSWNTRTPNFLGYEKTGVDMHIITLLDDLKVFPKLF